MLVTGKSPTHGSAIWSPPSAGVFAGGRGTLGEARAVRMLTRAAASKEQDSVPSSGQPLPNPFHPREEPWDDGKASAGPSVCHMTG